MNSELITQRFFSRAGKRRWLSVVSTLTILSTIVSCILVMSMIQLKELKHTESQFYLKANTDVLQHSINEHLESLENIADELADNITSSSMSPKDIQVILENTGAIYDGFVAIGAAFEPFALDDKLRLFAPYIVHFEGGYKTVRLDA